MNDIIKMILAMCGAVIGAAVAVYAVAGVAAAVSSVVGGVVAAGLYALPTVVCLGGAAYVASRQGYT